jgi:hypothetical protein
MIYRPTQLIMFFNYCLFCPKLHVLANPYGHLLLMMSLEFFFDIAFRPNYGPGVDSASNRNE